MCFHLLSGGSISQLRESGSSTAGGPRGLSKVEIASSPQSRKSRLQAKGPAQRAGESLRTPRHGSAIHPTRKRLSMEFLRGLLCRQASSALRLQKRQVPEQLVPASRISCVFTSFPCGAISQLEKFLSTTRKDSINRMRGHRRRVPRSGGIGRREGNIVQSDPALQLSQPSFDEECSL